MKYRSSTLTWDQPLPSGIHESNPCMSHAAWVNFDIFSNHDLNVFYCNLNWITDITVRGFPINSREFPERVTMSKPNDFVEHNKLTGWIQINNLLILWVSTIWQSGLSIRLQLTTSNLERSDLHKLWIITLRPSAY